MTDGISTPELVCVQNALNKTQNSKMPPTPNMCDPPTPHPLPPCTCYGGLGPGVNCPPPPPWPEYFVSHSHQVAFMRHPGPLAFPMWPRLLSQEAMPNWGLGLPRGRASLEYMKNQGREETSPRTPSPPPVPPSQLTNSSGWSRSILFISLWHGWPLCFHWGCPQSLSLSPCLRCLSSHHLQLGIH